MSSSDFDERLNRIKNSLGTTKASTEGLKSSKKDLDKLDISVDTDMKLGSDSSDSSDLEWNDDADNEKKGLLSESCDMEFESVKS